MLKNQVSLIKKDIDLINQTNNSNPYRALVDLFNFANLLNDNGGLIPAKPIFNLGLFKTKELKKEEEFCRVVNLHLSKLNRDPYAMNRAEQKLPSTVNNVYVGGVYGLFTHPVSFWLNKDSEPALEKWVRNFVNSHTIGMMKALA